MEKQVKLEQMSRCVWLDYFNKVLLEQKAISEEEYRKMRLKIFSLRSDHL